MLQISFWAMFLFKIHIDINKTNFQYINFYFLFNIYFIFYRKRMVHHWSYHWPKKKMPENTYAKYLPTNQRKSNTPSKFEVRTFHVLFWLVHEFIYHSRILYYWLYYLIKDHLRNNSSRSNTKVCSFSLKPSLDDADL